MNELQRRWGTISCRDALLPNAFNLLDQDEQPSTPVNQLHADFRLGIEQFSIDVGDEQAKVNVNALYAIKGKDRAEQAIKQLVTAVGANLKPRLRFAAGTGILAKSAPSSKNPIADDSGADPSAAEFPPIFGSWSEIFPDAQLIDLLPGSTSATANLTCWGNGLLNIRRASPASMTQMCSPILSPQQISQLLVIRSQVGDTATVEQLLAAVHAGTADALNLAGRLTVTSATQSLWIVSQDHNGTSRSLIIRDASNGGDVRSFNLQW